MTAAAEVPYAQLRVLQDGIGAMWHLASTSSNTQLGFNTIRWKKRAKKGYKVPSAGHEEELLTCSPSGSLTVAPHVENTCRGQGMGCKSRERHIHSSTSVDLASHLSTGEAP